MLLRLIVTEGPRTGEELVIRAAITLGRSKADFPLQDPKASSLHARIYTNEKGAIIIEDLESSNGTLVNGVRIQRSPLKAGDTISIGKTVFEVTAEASQEGKNAAEKGSWQEVIEEQLAASLEAFEKSPRPATSWNAFQQPLVLEFTQGLQTGARFVYGFGPREVGKYCPDGLLFDTHAPELAFTLVPDDTGGCELQTTVPGLFINDEKLRPIRKKSGEFAEKLKIGDRISFGQTVIVVKAL